MPVYAFADYRSQAQSINYCIIDLGTPPTGQLTPFEQCIYRIISEPWKRQASDFDERLFTHHPSEYLRIEDEQLDGLDCSMRAKWEAILNGLVQ